jgi:hypothetical protein
MKMEEKLKEILDKVGLKPKEVKVFRSGSIRVTFRGRGPAEKLFLTICTSGVFKNVLLTPGYDPKKNNQDWRERLVPVWRVSARVA